MIYRESDRARARAALRLLLAAVWIGGPMWKVYEAMFYNLAFFGETPSQDHVLAAVEGLATGAAIAVGVPVIGLLMGCLVGDRQAVREWALGLSFGLLAAAVLISVRQEYLRHHQETPAPTPTRSVCRPVVVAAGSRLPTNGERRVGRARPAVVGRLCAGRYRLPLAAPR